MVSVSSSWQREDGVSHAVSYSPNALNRSIFTYIRYSKMCASYVMGHMKYWHDGEFLYDAKKASQKGRTGKLLNLTAK